MKREQTDQNSERDGYKYVFPGQELSRQAVLGSTMRGTFGAGSVALLNLSSDGTFNAVIDGRWNDPITWEIGNNFTYGSIILGHLRGRL